MFIIIVEPGHEDSLGRRDFFFLSCQLYFFPYSLLSSYLLQLLFLISFLLVPFASVRENTRACRGSSFPIAMLNGTCFFLTVQLQVHNMCSDRKSINTCALVNLCF